MKKKIFLVLLIILFQASIISCSDMNNNSVDLYPAYERKGNMKGWGYINHKGDFLIPPIYDLTIKFNNSGLGKVYRQNKAGFININGEEVLPIEFDELNIVDDDLLIAEKDNKYFIFDTNGKELFSSSDYTFIGNYSEDSFVVEKEIDNGVSAMGFIDKNGKEIIEATYEKVFNFNQGKAVVKLYDSNYEIINKRGETIQKLDYNYVLPSSGGNEYLVVDDENRYGYLDRNGDIIVKPQFAIGSSFEDGYARVTNSDIESKNRLWGIIDEKGEYVIDPEYTNITYLGEDLFAVSKDKFVSAGSSNLTKHAIMTIKGELLTDYSYYNIGGAEGKFKNGMISVYDGEKTYILDKEGNRIKDIPEVNGDADIKLDKNIVEVLVDNRLFYYNNKGELVWKEDNSFILDNGGLVEEKKYLSNNNIRIFYPEIKKLKDKNVQEKINEELYNQFVTRAIEDIEDEKHSDIILKIVYNINEKNNILTIRKSSYNHSKDFTNGVSREDIYHINLEDGRFFSLGDLFKEDSNYIEKLNEILKGKMKNENDESLGKYNIDEFDTIRENQNFILGKEKLKIYFYPGEIVAADQGTISSTILYEEIEEIIDKESKLWQIIIKNKGD